MGIVLNPDDCEVIKMKKLNELVRKFIEKKSKMDLNNHDAELSEIEGSIRDQGYDPEAIYDVVKNIEPEERDNVLEAMLKPIGSEKTWKKPIKVGDNGFLSRSVHTRETDQGLERIENKPLIVAACKKVISEEEIGSQCSVCNEYECKEHVFFCNSCGRSLCIRHVHFFTNEEGKNIPYCEECYKLVTENQDTWKTIPRMPWKQEKEK